MNVTLPPIEDLATRQWGERNTRLSTRTELRYGKNGSKSVIPNERKWFDHEAGAGGGYDDLYEMVHGKRPPDQSAAATYDYRDAAGKLLFQVVRKIPKTFRQRRPDGAGGWIWDLRGVERVPYRLPELLRATHYAPVFICEGEKDCDALYERGLIATTNPGGAGKWQASLCGHFHGRDVVILPDNDPPGEEHAADVQRKLQGIARTVVTLRLPDLPPKGDVSDWFAAGGTAEELEHLTAAAQAQPVEHKPNGQAGAHATGVADGHTSNGPQQVEWRNVRLASWAGRTIPEREWIMPGWIPLEQTTGLYGEAGRNKTDFLLQLLMATSRGLPFCGYPLTPGPAYGLFCEDTEHEIVRRAHRIASHYGLSLADFPDFHFASLVGFDETEFVSFEGQKLIVGQALIRFDRAIAEYRARIGGLDTAPDFFGGEEISRRQVSQFVRRLDAVSMTRHCALLFTAHPSVRGAASGSFESGSTGWAAKVRARLSLHDPGEEDEDADEAAERRRKRLPVLSTDRRILTLQKANYARTGETIELVCRNGIFTTAALDAERAAARGQRGPTRDAATDARFLELLAAVKAQGSRVHDMRNSPGRYAPKVFSRRPDGKVFSEAEYARAMQRLFVAKRLRLEAHGPPSRSVLWLAEALPGAPS
jgi:RecA-family ATPase